MRENQTTHLVEVPVGGKDGFTWNRLHGERENICENLIKEPAERRRKLLQTRLRKVDDALDRLMSGSYGHCPECGREIAKARLEIDPALAFCGDCRKGEPRAAASEKDEFNEPAPNDVWLESLNPFDTILLRTHNNDYRILLLDPKTGRALVEGGEYLVEPNDALIRGSEIPGSEFKSGWICAGSRLEIWVGERVLITSTIKSVHVKHNSAAESVDAISAALH